MNEPKVIVAGHACLDITPVFPDGRETKQISDILAPGKLVYMNGVAVNPGGLVSNTGLAMKILGADVKLMAKAGDDDFGRILHSIYEKQGAEDGLIIDEKGTTSYSVVLAPPGIDRIFLHNPGTNDTFSFQDIQNQNTENTALFHFGYPSIMKRMYQNQGAELIEIMKYMKGKGTATSLDLAAVDENSEAGRADWSEILSKVMPYVDFFVPSIEEVCYMLDRERFNEWVQRANGKDITSILNVEQDIRPVADLCMKLGAKILLLKCGAPGLYYRTQSAEVLQTISKRIQLNVEDWSDQDGFERSYIPTQVLSATGAGDTTIAAFLTAMLQGYSFEMSIHLAAATGACCVAAYDSISGLVPLKELSQKITAGWKKS